LKFSVIVPVYNGTTVIERCLDALYEQTAARDAYEIIVVDDGSTDQTALIVENWCNAHVDCATLLVRQDNSGPAAARNHGARCAQASLLLFTDADCAPLPHWVETLSQAFEDRNVGGAKGTYLSQQQQLVPRFVQAEYEDRYDRMRTLPSIDFIDTYSAAYRRDLFLEQGGFDPIFPTASVEDQEFSFRLARAGIHMVFVPHAQVSHIHDENLAEYARRKYYIGYWKALLARRYPERMVQDSHTPQILKLQIFFVALLIGVLIFTPISVALDVNSAGIFGLIMALLISLILTALPFAKKLWQRSWQLTLISPLLIIARALALGSGFLLGTLRFRIFSKDIK